MCKLLNELPLAWGGGLEDDKDETIKRSAEVEIKIVPDVFKRFFSPRWNAACSMDINGFNQKFISVFKLNVVFYRYFLISTWPPILIILCE